jgi:hypothetical protein
LSYLADGDAAV